MFTIKHTICPSCSVGCGLNIISDGNDILGTYPYKRHPVNEGKNCLNGRNSIKQFVNRIYKPSLVKDKKLVELDEDSAFDRIKEELSSIKPEELVIICSGNNTNEEIDFIKNFAQEFGCENIGFYGYNFYNTDVSEISYDDIENAKTILAIGDIIRENPLAGRRIILSKENCGTLISVDTVEKSVTQLNSDEFIQIENIAEFINSINDDVKAKLSDDAVILVNKLESKEDLKALEELANETGAKLLPILTEPNSKGAMEKIDSLTADEISNILENSKVLIVVNANPLEYLQSEKITDKFIINISNFEDDLTSISDVIIPGRPWTEKEGSFTNSEGLTQEFKPSVESKSDCLSEIEIFERISNSLG